MGEFREGRKPKLLASSPTLEGIQDCIAKFYGGERKKLQEYAPGRWLVCRVSGQHIPNMLVVLRNGRYRFETVD